MAATSPKLQAFLIADHVYRDALTGKAIIAGVFSNINAREVPALFPGCWAYANVVGAPESFQCRLRLVDLSSLEELASSPVLPAKNNGGVLAHSQLIIQVPPLQFTHFGAYDFELLINEEPLKGLRFTVSESKKGKAT